MKKISSNLTFFYKKILPLYFLVFIFSLIVIGFISEPFQNSTIFLVSPLIIASLGFIIFRKLIWNLCDNVYDCGDFLLFKNGKKEKKVYFKDIINVAQKQFLHPERVTIYTQNENKITFSPLLKHNLFSSNPIVKELIKRVEQTKQTTLNS
eukprot:TRINITY_DN22570_c0_g1_i3.p1 TRINITY_DN22570_c0_g1~~TRINITY_DN22570_c0_g1_i3.p1  ORF type:complete len:151 (-),score=8.91 TRINITY_DN22570_c0_g1_i3:183-635(-)